MEILYLPIPRIAVNHPDISMFHTAISNIFVLSTGSEGISCACNKYLAGSLGPAKDLLQKKVLLPKPMQTEVPYRNN